MSNAASAPSESSRTGVVLSGGGMRGAYEVGVIAGIAEVLDAGGAERPLFDVVGGTSVGAINAAYLVANGHRGDHGIGGLADLWRRLRIERHGRLRPLGLLGWRNGGNHRTDAVSGSALLDVEPLESMVRSGIAWQSLHENIAGGVVQALIVAALHVSTGRTTMFAELAPGVTLRTSRDERRTACSSPIGLQHVLASAALPLVFPARRIGSGFYCDGGLRFNTPMAPVLRVGTDKLLVISALHPSGADADRSPSEPVRRCDDEPSAAERDATDEGVSFGLFFLLGKLLDALLLDSVRYDLHVLQRLNGLLEALESCLTDEELEDVQRVVQSYRGAEYRRVDTLVFMPSQDLGVLAGDHLRERRRRGRLPRVADWLMRYVDLEHNRELDWASYLFLDGELAEHFMAAGRQDALKRADEVHAFFAR